MKRKILFPILALVLALSLSPIVVAENPGDYSVAVTISALPPEVASPGDPVQLTITETNDGTISPVNSRDKKGPTAVLNSAAKVDLVGCESTLLNLKFTPAVLKDMEGIQKFLFLLKSYFDRGGYQLQCNVVSKEVLIDAKEHPERHRELLVRVAGFSAYFVELAPEVQDEIIARTEYSL